MDRNQQRVVVVTGGAQGIGAATVLRFLAAGDTVYAVDVKEEGLAKLAAAGDEPGSPPRTGRLMTVTADVSSPSDVASLIAGIAEEQGRIDVLVNNAGVTLAKRFTQTTEADWQRVVDINLKSVYLMCHDSYPLLRDSGGASVVNVASQNGLVGRPAFSVYGATKAGVITLSRSLAAAWGPKNIRVNSVCPGSVRTPMLLSAFGKSGRPDTEERLTAAVTPLGRIGEADEVATVIEFFAGPMSSFVSGQTLCVDGGRTAGIAESFHWEQTAFDEDATA